MALRAMPRSGSQERVQSVGEEIANSVSSGISLLAILCGIPFLIRSAAQHGSKLSLAGVIVFAIAMGLLYLASTIYHAWPRTDLKKLFRLFDHSAIFLLIAGTYTPFALGPLRGVWGWVLLGTVWCLAFLGIGFRAIGGCKIPVDLDLLVCRYGLDGRFRDSPVLGARTARRITLAGRRRTCLHRRDRFLPGQAAPL